MIKADTYPDIYMSEINQLRDELNDLEEVTFSERLTIITLDVLPAKQYSRAKL